MFQRLTRVLFGDTVEDNSLCEAKLHLNEKEEDDEWILVDYLADSDPASYNNKVIEEPSQEVSAPDNQALYSSCSPLYILEDPEDGSFLCAQEEGWIVTPPPCFTAGGQAPVLLETSPLENLLIEHPSMNETQKKRSHLPGCNTGSLPVSLRCFEQSKRRCLRQRVKDNINRQRLSHNGLRRLNLLHESSAHQTQGNTVKVHQPGQRQFNY